MGLRRHKTLQSQREIALVNSAVKSRDASQHTGCRFKVFSISLFNVTANLPAGHILSTHLWELNQEFTSITTTQLNHGLKAKQLKIYQTNSVKAFSSSQHALQPETEWIKWNKTNSFQWSLFLLPSMLCSFARKRTSFPCSLTVLNYSVHWLIRCVFLTTLIMAFGTETSRCERCSDKKCHRPRLPPSLPPSLSPSVTGSQGVSFSCRDGGVERRGNKMQNLHSPVNRHVDRGTLKIYHPEADQCHFSAMNPEEMRAFK